MSEATDKETDEKDREEPRHEPNRRFKVLRGGRLVEVASRPMVETR